MSIIVWIVLGLMTGFVASELVDATGARGVLDLVLGGVGAMVGGGLLHLFGQSEVNEVHVYSLLMAIVGVIVFLLVYQAMHGRARTR
jgi:uncharacterized membrane protein YeaQ/YmgE (transglycosylase-associated protein family)